MAVTPDGGRAISASDDQTLRLWDLESGQTIRTLEGHTSGVALVTVTSDGRRAVSAGDRTLRVWDLESGKKIATFTGDGVLYCCVFAPDGGTIVTGGQLGRVHFLRLVEADKTKPAIGDAKIRLLPHKEQAS